MKKYIKVLGIGFCVIFIVEAIFLGIASGSKATISSDLKQVNGTNKNYPFYTMTYKGDYGLDDYLKVGSKGRKEYLKYITKNVTKEGDYDVHDLKPNCSSFTITAPNGDRLFARNFDTEAATPVLLKTNQNNRYKTIGMANLIWLDTNSGNPPEPFSKNKINPLGSPYMTTDGMNEHGLAISFLTAEGSSSFDDSNKISLNDFSLIRMVLDKASSVEEAVKMIGNYNMDFYFKNYPSHFMIADATGASTIVEYVDGKLQTVYSDKPYQIVTNFILYDNPKGGFGLERYQRIEKKLKATAGILNEKEAMKLLSENTINGLEQWSVVYNLTQKKAYVCVGKDYENSYEFNIE